MFAAGAGKISGRSAFFALFVSISMSAGCSVKRIAVNMIGETLARGTTVYTSDEDPELVRGALPFGLKLIESLLIESPRHRGLLFAAASGFTQYSYAFVQQDGDELVGKDLDAAGRLRERAKRLYLRARNYGLRGLEAGHRGFVSALRGNPREAVKVTKAEDVPLLYWTAVSWSAAVSLSKDDPELIGDLPMIEALIDRALQLDETFDDGAIHSFLITYEMSRQGAAGDPETRARKHFKRAMELCGGKLASPLVALAEAVAVPKQDKEEFRALLNRALAVNPDAKPEWRLLNLVYQRRARWLLENTDRFILD